MASVQRGALRPSRTEAAAAVAPAAAVLGVGTAGGVGDTSDDQEEDIEEEEVYLQLDVFELLAGKLLCTCARP